MGLQQYPTDSAVTPPRLESTTTLNWLEVQNSHLKTFLLKLLGFGVFLVLVGGGHNLFDSYFSVSLCLRQFRNRKDRNSKAHAEKRMMSMCFVYIYLKLIFRWNICQTAIP